MPKLMQFQEYRVIRGMNVMVTFCAKTKTDACEILGVSSHSLRTGTLCFEPKDKECIESPNKKFIRFDSGEMCYAKPEWRNKIIDFDVMMEFIEHHRRTCKTYYDTIKKNEQNVEKKSKGSKEKGKAEVKEK